MVIWVVLYCTFFCYHTFRGVKQMMKNKGMAILYELLPEEVLMEILSRVPAKSLLRFKSVSKYWYSLIQNPSFISLHHTRAQPYKYCITLMRLMRSVENQYHSFNCSLYLDPNKTSFEDVDLSFATPHPDETFRLRGSCKGLMCLSYRSTIVICNPVTREFRALPQPPYHTLYTTYVGFAFDTKTNDYKVLRFSTLIDVVMGIFHKIQVYSVSSDSWKEIVGTVPEHVFPLRQPSILLDGFFYWLGYDCSTSVTVIDTLNTVEGLFERRSLPICVGSNSQTNLCLMNDSLALVAPKYDDQLGVTCFDVWLMDEYGVEECWTKKCTIGPLLGNQRSFGFWPNNEVLLTGCANGLIVSYNHSTRDIKEYKQLFNLPGQSYLMEVFPYSESLVPIKRRVDLS